MANLTLTQCQSALERLKKDISDVSQATFIEWCNFANRQFYDYIVGIDPERYIDQSNTYTVTSEPQTSALPSDFYHIQPTECGFYEIDSNSKNTDKRLVRTGFGSQTKGYYIQGTNVVFTGMSGSEQFRLRYIPVLTTETALSDSIILDEIYLQAFVADLDVLYSQWDEESGMESLADFRFVRTLSALGQTIKKEPRAYALSDFSQYY